MNKKIIFFIFVISLIPILISESFATHNDETINDKWEFRGWQAETDWSPSPWANNYQGYCTITNTNGFSIDSVASTAMPSCYLLLPIEKSLILNQNFTLTYDYSRLSGASTSNVYFYLLDDEIHANNYTAFPSRTSIPQLTSIGSASSTTTGNGRTLTINPTYGSSTHDYVTLAVLLSDSQTSDTYRLNNLSISSTNGYTWDFSDSSAEYTANPPVFESRSTIEEIIGYVYTQETGVPTTPELIIEQVTNTQVKLEWSESYSYGSSVTGHKIEKNCESAGWSNIVADTGDTQRWYIATDLTNGDSCIFRVSTISSLGTSNPSNEVTITLGTSPNPLTESEDEVIGLRPHGNDDSKWYYREHDLYSSYTVVCTQTTSASSTILTSSSSGLGQCFWLKSFDKADYDGMNLKAYWSGTRSGSSTVLTCVTVYDGDYEPYYNTQDKFIDNSNVLVSNLIGGGYLGETCQTNTVARLNALTVTPIWASSTESKITVILRASDGQSGTGISIHDVKIQWGGGLGNDYYRLPLSTEENISLVNEVTGTGHDSGYVMGSDPYPPRFSNVTSATVHNSTSVTINWTTPSQDGQIPVDTYSVYYSSPPSTGIKLLASNVGNVTTYQTNQLEAGNQYEFFVRAENEDYLGFGGFGYILETDGGSNPISTSDGADPPTFSSITEHGAVMDWTATDTSENLYGYGIQISTDDTNFISIIQNTATNNDSYLLTSLEIGTLYYVQWRNVFYNGTYGDWSQSGTFTTLTMQSGGGSGGGGGTSPVKNIKNTIPEEDMTEEFQPPPEKIGLSALSLFQTNKEIIAPGETKKALLQIVWQGDTNLLIKEIIADESTGLKFAFQQPIEFQSLGTGNQTSNIPYVLEAPAEICETEQTANCIWSEAEYDIPVKIFAKSNGEDISFDSRLTVQVTTGFDFNLQQLVLLIIGLLVLAVILGRKRKPKRENALRHNSRPKTRKSK